MSEQQEKTESEEKKKADGQNEKLTEIYEMEGIAGHFYLTENGEFKWIPSSKACGCIEDTKRILEVLKMMPSDRRAVWTQRLDLEEAKTTCPVMCKEAVR